VRDALIQRQCITWWHRATQYSRYWFCIGGSRINCLLSCAMWMYSQQYHIDWAWDETSTIWTSLSWGRLKMQES